MNSEVHGSRNTLITHLMAHALGFLESNGIDYDSIGKSHPGIDEPMAAHLTTELRDMAYAHINHPEVQEGIRWLLWVGVHHYITHELEKPYQDDDDAEVLAVVDELRDRGFKVTSIHASLRLAVASGLTPARALELARAYPANPKYGNSPSYLLKVAVAELTGVPLR